MKVAIDAGPLTGGHSVRGIGVSIKGLVAALEKYNSDKDIKIDAIDFSASDLSGYDVVHYTTFNPYFLNVPRIDSVKGKVVVTIHDLIPFIYKNEYPSGVKGFLRLQFNKYLLRKAGAIITVSETSKKDIVRILGVNPERINVIYWAADEIFKNVQGNTDLNEVRKLYKLPMKFVLYVGDVNYNKNLSTLITACNLINIPLVIVGKQAKYLDEMTTSWKSINGPRDMLRSFLGQSHPEVAHFKKLSEMVGKSGVITTGYVPTGDLVKIYSLASVYCQPSFYEGFGLPVLEAFSCGVPVVISKTQALTEITAGSALVADPNSAKDFAEKISSLLKDSTEKLHLVRSGKTRAKEFSWENTAEKTLEVYRKIKTE